MMNDNERLHLQKMIQANNTEDTTNAIRSVKHSNLIYEDVQQLISLKTKYARLSKSNPNEFDAICTSRCAFLFNHYTDIFNKVKKNEIDLKLLNNFLNVLKQIEDGKIDQHEGSFMVGKILKEIYIDSALKKSDNLDKKNNKAKTEKIKKPEKISWLQFKQRSVEDNKNIVL